MQYQGRPGGNLYVDAVETFTALLGETGAIPSVGRVEEKLGLKPGALSAVFRDESQLVCAMAQNAWMRLHDQCVRVLAGATESDPVTQFELLAEVYIDWAHQHPREFTLIGSMPADEFQGNEELMRYETAIHELMLRMLARARDERMLDRDENLPLLVSTAHTFAYGAISKMMLGDLSRWVPGWTDREVARDMLHLFIRKMLRPTPELVEA
ncbi:MAG TPA: WHG domain-containing protein [Paracoccus sp. (in: a-proteobacteria)]|uniref:TetR-like C-terminal domain-containing protein n=1 Tax=Paracoccus sp. TaxID=267 RepID=UPI002CE42CA4|nr:WHG domain-containing protein [Paracoccus sp. (in: a-proteobacteria)]HWL56073.1 WHG domain-containing protein [Paracoccus sp. (in: a-proteobacteria)]